MALELPRSRGAGRQISVAPPPVPIDQIIAIRGQNPLAQGISTVADTLSQAIQRRNALRMQAAQVQALAQAAGQPDISFAPGTSPDLAEKQISLNQARQTKADALGRMNQETFIKALRDKQGYVEYDPQTGRRLEHPGLPIDVSQGPNGAPIITVQQGQAFPPAKTISLGGSGKGGGGAGTQNKMASDLQSDLDPNGFRAGQMGKNQARVDNAGRVLTLLDQPNFNANALQAPEIAQSVASLLSSNQGRVAQEQLDNLTPHSLKGNIMKQIGFVTNSPVGLGQQKFFDSLKQTAVREKSLAQAQVRTAQSQRLGRHEMLRKTDPATYGAILHNYGLDPSKVKDGRYIDTPVIAPPPSAGGVDPAVARLIQRHGQ